MLDVGATRGQGPSHRCVHLCRPILPFIHYWFGCRHMLPLLMWVRVVVILIGVGASGGHCMS